MKSKKRVFLHNQKAHFDYILLILIVILCFFGLLMIYNASSVSALSDFGDKYYYLKEQTKWLIIGLLILGISSQINYKKWYKLAVPLIFVNLILLTMVFIPGLGILAYGSRRWLNMGFFIIQPAELAKLSLIIYLSAWFSGYERNRFFAFLSLLGMVVGLVILEPDLGTALVIGIVAIIIYFISGASFLHFLFLIPVIIATGIIAAVTSPYRLQRILTFLNPNQDPLGTSYHVRQILITLGSGGLFGLGLGKSRQKYAYLPEATTDSIFAIIAEEIGFIGVLIFIGLLLFILYRCFKIAREAPDKFSYLLGMGITFWLSIQILINLSAMTLILPLTGVPLPFISYGGSGLVVSLFGLGILLNISKHRLIKK